MASNLDQFPELELSKEDREQIFEYIDPPVVVGETNRTQNGARYVDFVYFSIVIACCTKAGRNYFYVS